MRKVRLGGKQVGVFDGDGCRMMLSLSDMPDNTVQELLRGNVDLDIQEECGSTHFQPCYLGTASTAIHNNNLVVIEVARLYKSARVVK